MTRGKILNKALEATQDRGPVYGTPQGNFSRIAELWNAQLGPETLKEQLNAHDVAQMIILIKLARLATTPDHEDSVVDVAGYAALMGELE